jgi:UDP-N-acetylglucosamine 2-epimerase
VPCLTLRENAERPITISQGTNLLVGTDPAKIVAATTEIFAGKGKTGRIPQLRDGHTAERIGLRVLRREVPRDVLIECRKMARLTLLRAVLCIGPIRGTL